MKVIDGKDVDFVKSNVTGGHYGFVTERAQKVFTNKMKEAQMIELREDDIVADIGTYVGEFSLLASPQVKQVNSYEATPTTFKVLELNKKDNMNINNMAVVGDDSKEITLFISTGVGVTNSIVKTKKGGITVPAIKYEDAIKDATVVKIDVEGAEYGYNIVDNLDNIRAITIEWHPITGNKEWQKVAYDLMDQIEAKGFTCLYKPKFSTGWDMNCTYVREDR